MRFRCYPLPSVKHLILPILFCAPALAADQPQWGQAWSRNMVSSETNLPETFDPASGKNLRWTVKLGTEGHSTPVVAGGKIYLGTNNGAPRDPKHQGDRGVFCCLEEKSGNLLWQLVVPKRDEDQYFDWPNIGMSSVATVEGDRIYLLTNRHEVVCLDANGLTNGNDGSFQDEGRHMAPKSLPAMTPGPLDADILWCCDLVAEAGIWPHDGAHSSILILGNHLYLNTCTGVDNTHRKIRTPDAPSLIVLDKRTGKILARDRENIAPNVFHATWSSPSLGKLEGREVVFFCGGNGITYAFEPLPQSADGDSVATLRKIWQYDIDPEAPKTEVHRFTQNRREGPSNIFGMPVILGDRLYLAGGGDIFWGKAECWLKCVRATGKGDVTGSATVWSVPLGQHTMSTVAVMNGLVFVTDTAKTLHCRDAATGTAHWTHEMKGQFWSSPMVADGKVYLGSRQGDFCILAASKEKNLLCSVELKSPISATATAANGVVYIATMNALHAIGQPLAAAAQP